MLLKQTPLIAIHRELGAKLIEFGGWEMPVYYSSIVDEHQVVRRHVGLFDIAHMGEFFVRGPGAAAFLNRVLTNDVARLRPGLGQYSLLCNPDGGVIDDLYLYQLDTETFLLVVNASRIDEDFQWLRSQVPAAASEASSDGAFELTDESAAFGAVAVQGPKAAALVDDAFPIDSQGPTQVGRPSELKKNEIAPFAFGAGRIWISRTGYTGEDGFEIVARAAAIAEVWTQLSAKGHAHCLQPAGLGARDTLRTEACFPLYGHELDEKTSPLEAGLGFAVALDKPEFIGRESLVRQKADGVGRRLVAFHMTGKAPPPRQGYPIHATKASDENSDSESEGPIGIVTSGTQSPSEAIGIGLGYVPPSHAKPRTPLKIEIRNRTFPAVVRKKPRAPISATIKP